MKKQIVFLFLLFSFAGYAQLPAQWYGHYKGELSILGLDGNTLLFPMEFILSNIDDSTANWVIIYGEDSLRQEREYRIIQTKKNRFMIDEQNGIILSCNRFNNQMVSIFEVQGSLIHAVYTFEKKKMRFDLTASTNRLETGRVSQLSADSTNNEAIPLVYTYATTSHQWAELKRIKNKK